jgi:cobalt/nickel transport system ATP-binding protein
MRIWEHGELEGVAIELRDVSYSYPDGHLALHGVSLKVARGERIAVLGANGAGKSTLLMLMNGLYSPSTGTVNVLGNPTTGQYLSTVRREVGLVFQDPDDQLFCPTLWDDVCFGPLNMGLSEEDVRERSAGALKAMALEGYEERLPHHLSVGERKRAAIATVLAMRPKILILDEPTANLDPKGRLELSKLLRTLYDRYDLTLIVATHDVNFVPEIADRACVLNHGRLIANGPMGEIFQNGRVMEQASLEPPIITQLYRAIADDKSKGVFPLTVREALSRLGYRAIEQS